MKKRWKTEGEILEAIDRAQANLQKHLRNAEFQEAEAKRCFKEEAACAGNAHKALAARAERSAQRIESERLPYLKRKLSIWRTDTLRFREPEVKSDDRSIPH